MTYHPVTLGGAATPALLSAAAAADCLEGADPVALDAVADEHVESIVAAVRHDRRGGYGFPERWPRSGMHRRCVECQQAMPSLTKRTRAAGGATKFDPFRAAHAASWTTRRKGGSHV